MDVWVVFCNESARRVEMQTLAGKKGSLTLTTGATDTHDNSTTDQHDLGLSGQFWLTLACSLVETVRAKTDRLVDPSTRAQVVGSNGAAETVKRQRTWRREL